MDHWSGAEVNSGSNKAAAMGLIGSEDSPPDAPVRIRFPFVSLGIYVFSVERVQLKPQVLGPSEKHGCPHCRK